MIAAVLRYKGVVFMKVTVIVDNIISPEIKKPLLAEHGLSLLLEVDDYKILLDSGQSNIVTHNLALLGVHPNQLNAMVISHGHYDHTGGVPHILRQRANPINIYAHDEIFKRRYAVNKNGTRYIGIPFLQAESLSLGAQWNFHTKPIEIIPNLWFSGTIPRNTDFERGDSRFVAQDKNQQKFQDKLLDDTVLYYISKTGLIVISGCAHSGFINIIERGLALTGSTRLAGWIGGTHLGASPQKQQKETIQALREYNPEFIFTSHCTGFSIMAELQREFGAKFMPAFVGNTINII